MPHTCAPRTLSHSGQGAETARQPFWTRVRAPARPRLGPARPSTLLSPLRAPEFP